MELDKLSQKKFLKSWSLSYFIVFNLQSQDEYMEHNSTVSYCRFGPTGQYVASLDMAGIVK